MPEPMQDTLFRTLPGIYRQEGKVGFTYRILGLYAEVLETIEDEILRIHKQLDPKHADAEFLAWLASWVAFLLDETWEESNQRDLIGRVVQLYTKRGTVEGLREFVEIFTGIRPDVIEEFQAGWRVEERSTVEVDTRAYGTWQENAHRFSVKILTFEEFTMERKAKVLERVLIEKPAHTQLVHIAFFASFWQVGVRSTLGVDTRTGG